MTSAASFDVLRCVRHGRPPPGMGVAMPGVSGCDRSSRSSCRIDARSSVCGVEPRVHLLRTRGSPVSVRSAGLAHVTGGRRPRLARWGTKSLARSLIPIPGPGTPARPVWVRHQPDADPGGAELKVRRLDRADRTLDRADRTNHAPDRRPADGRRIDLAGIRLGQGTMRRRPCASARPVTSGVNAGRRSSLAAPAVQPQCRDPRADHVRGPGARHSEPTRPGRADVGGFAEVGAHCSITPIAVCNRTDLSSSCNARPGTCASPASDLPLRSCSARPGESRRYRDEHRRAGRATGGRDARR